MGYKILRTAPEMKFKRGFPEKQGSPTLTEYIRKLRTELAERRCDTFKGLDETGTVADNRPRSTATQREIRVSVKRALLDDPDGA